MRREIRVRTPENVEFGLRLAGLATRFAAALADYAIVAFLVGLLAGAMLVLALALGVALPGIGAFASAGVMAVLFLAIFVVLFGYFTFFEMIWNGQTPGKRVVGLRVVKDLGQGITFADSLVRNLVRIADILPGFYGVAAASVLLSARNKRLGDHAAGTLVVVVERDRAPSTFEEKWERHNSLREDAPLAARIRQEITPEETELVRDLWKRRVRLVPAHRAALSARLAAHLRARLKIPPMPEVPDEQLLRDVLELLFAPPAR